MQIEDRKRGKVVKQIFMPYAPVYDDQERNHFYVGWKTCGYDWYKWTQHRELGLKTLNEQTNLCKLEALTLQDYTVLASVSRAYHVDYKSNMPQN